jgi:hypothetical protein
MDRRRASGTAFSLVEAVAIIVPVCTEVAQYHAQGLRLFVHPSAIYVGPDGFAHIAADAATSTPMNPRDRACVAPEARQAGGGDARASVFSVGALVYELLTGEAVGPGMRRPTELIPDLDPMVETVLGKALVADWTHRPDDLGALAQALYHLAPGDQAAPPAADQTALDRGSMYPVDVSLSMLPPTTNGASHPPAYSAPPAPAVQAVPPRAAPAPAPAYGAPVPPAPPSAYGVHVYNATAVAQVRVMDNPTARLADLKARLESDPRPRYVVIKDGMDHGPFNAVELLHQIGAHAFHGDHLLRDTIASDERPIQDWEEFAPFVEQTRLHREIKAEKKEIERVVVAEAKANRGKTFIGLAVLGVLLLGAGAWFLKTRGERDDSVDVAADDGVSVDTNSDIKGKGGKKARHAGAPGAGGVPVLSGGMTCEAARAKYVEEINVGGPRGQADLTANQYGAILNNGSYIGACGTPNSMHVTVCAAVQNGHAVGVTVTTEPPNGGIANCIASAVRRMSFPSNPKLDVATTRF